MLFVGRLFFALCAQTTQARPNATDINAATLYIIN